MVNEHSTDKGTPKWILKLKSTIRPVLTYVFTTLYLYVFIKRDKYEIQDLSNLTTIMVVIILFWFGERLAKNTGLTSFLLSLQYKDKDNTKKK